MPCSLDILLPVEALAVGGTVGSVLGVTSLAGTASCYLGLKVASYCKQKQNSLPEGSHWTTMAKIGKFAALGIAALSATLAIVSSSLSGATIAAGLACALTFGAASIIATPITVALIILGLAGGGALAALCLYKMQQNTYPGLLQQNTESRNLYITTYTNSSQYA